MLTTTIGERDAQRPASRSMPGWRGTRTRHRSRRVAATWDRASTPCSALGTRTTSRASYTATRPRPPSTPSAARWTRRRGGRAGRWRWALARAATRSCRRTSRCRPRSPPRKSSCYQQQHWKQAEARVSTHVATAAARQRVRRASRRCVWPPSDWPRTSTWMDLHELARVFFTLVVCRYMDRFGGDELQNDHLLLWPLLGSDYDTTKTTKSIKNRSKLQTVSIFGSSNI